MTGPVSNGQIILLRDDRCNIPIESAAGNYLRRCPEPAAGISIRIREGGACKTIL